MKNKDIIYSQENERRRIAEELHDTTVQDMICLSQQLELAFLYMDKDLVQAKLELMTAKKQIKGIISGIRDTIYDLRPMSFDDIGWNASISRLRDEIVDTGIYVEFDVDNIDVSDGVTAISVYRIVCEACKNIIKHSKADCMWLSVKCYDNYINVIIRDNGVGFNNNAESNHFGLKFMRDRVSLLSGNISINSSSKGTFIEISIPF